VIKKDLLNIQDATVHVHLKVNSDEV